MNGVDLGHGFEARKLDALVPQRWPFLGQRLNNLACTELAQATEVHQQARQSLRQRSNARHHGQRHAVTGLDGTNRCDHVAVVLAHLRVRHPGRSQGRDKALERCANREWIDLRQRMRGLLTRECCQCLKRRLPQPMLRHRLHRQQVQQTTGKQNAATAADLNARQAPLGGKQRRRHTGHAGADHGNVVALGCCVAHGLTSHATAASSVAWRNSSPNSPQCSASANSACASCSPHKIGCWPRQRSLKKSTISESPRCA